MPPFTTAVQYLQQIFCFSVSSSVGGWAWQFYVITFSMSWYMARTLLWTEVHNLPMSTRISSRVSLPGSYYLGRRAQKTKAVSACCGQAQSAGCGLLWTGSICLLWIGTVCPLWTRYSLPAVGRYSLPAVGRNTVCLTAVGRNTVCLPAVVKHKKNAILYFKHGPAQTCVYTRCRTY